MSKIRVDRLQALFDTENEHQGYSSLVNGLLGEELASAVFKAYVDAEGGSCEVLNGTPSEDRSDLVKVSEAMDAFEAAPENDGEVEEVEEAEPAPIGVVELRLVEALPANNAPRSQFEFAF